MWILILFQRIYQLSFVILNVSFTEAVSSLLSVACVSLMFTDSRFLFTENVQFSYVSLRCTSSAGQRARGRHSRRAGAEDGFSITAEFELDVNLEEVTGWSLCASCLLRSWTLCFSFTVWSAFGCCLFVTKQTKMLKYLLFWLGSGGSKLKGFLFDFSNSHIFGGYGWFFFFLFFWFFIVFVGIEHEIGNSWWTECFSQQRTATWTVCVGDQRKGWRRPSGRWGNPLTGSSSTFTLPGRIMSCPKAWLTQQNCRDTVC